MKRARSWDDPENDIQSEQSSCSDFEMENFFPISKSSSVSSFFEMPIKQLSPEETILQRAESYHLYMKQIPIPSDRGSLVPFNSWTELGRSLKVIYRQPLHYLTNILLKQWDKERIGTEDEDKPLDAVIHPAKAESTIWLVEEVHRLTSSHHHLARLWLLDPMHQAHVDSIVLETYPGKAQDL